MSMFRIFDVAGSAVSAQSQRLNVVAEVLPRPRAGVVYQRFFHYSQRPKSRFYRCQWRG
jgi:hypothetical protein